MPTHLLIFLGLHEQSQLGFQSIQHIQKLSSINLLPSEGLPEVTVPESRIQFINDLPKTTYILVARFYCHSKRSSSEEQDQVAVLSSLKTHGDFKRLHDLIKETNLKTDDGRA
jgi:hypothetical protein